MSAFLDQTGQFTVSDNPVHPSRRFRDDIRLLLAVLLGVFVLVVAVCVGFCARSRRATRRALEQEASSEATIGGLRRELTGVRLQAKARLRHERAGAKPRLQDGPGEVGVMCGEPGRAAGEVLAEQFFQSGRAASDDEAEGADGKATESGVLPLEMTPLFGLWGGGGTNEKRVSFAATHYFQGGC